MGDAGKERSGEPRRALVTGAGSGIGRAIAELLARQGDRVTGTVRDPERARALTAAAAAAGLGLRFRPLELAAAESIAGLAEALAGEGGVDLLVQNAGFGVFGAFEEIPPEAAARQLAVLLAGPLELLRRLLPGLRERRGRVIWIGSLADRLPLPFQAHYSAAKAAVAAVSDALRMELAPLGVQLCCVEPGDFATGFTDARQLFESDGSVYGGRVERCLARAIADERGGPAPEAVARIVARLSRRARMPARRPVGRWARSIALAQRLLPDRLRERLLRLNYDV